MCNIKIKLNNLHKQLSKVVKRLRMNNVNIVTLIQVIPTFYSC